MQGPDWNSTAIFLAWVVIKEPSQGCLSSRILKGNALRLASGRKVNSFSLKPTFSPAGCLRQES